ncbi:Uncharacterized protein BM_BM13638 [Brugia malayi]|uniref:Bm13638 n=1 Tax=Brugia malayi TaxID=6279 RepID=A0A0K0IYD9_BRUMA|nr:Uncharacterized protein BM_BM13638 [Brugia malayi]CDQ02217.1 Bm13638 [Brugia malayi]VIO96292.1 Uncharacterized protein BM_BM13638 [Brugia malayi]
MFLALYQIAPTAYATGSFARKLNSNLMKCIHRNIESNV